MLKEAVSIAMTLSQAFLFTPDDVQKAPRGHPHEEVIRTIFYYEIGRGVTNNNIRYEPYDPYMPHGDPRCYGPGGLCEYGLLREFTQWTTNNSIDEPDRYNPYQVATYINWVLSQGRHSNWPYLR